MRVKCLAQEHNTMSSARTRTRTTRSGVKHTNHEATAPPFQTREKRDRKLQKQRMTDNISQHMTDTLPLGAFFIAQIITELCVRPRLT